MVKLIISAGKPSIPAGEMKGKDSVADFSGSTHTSIGVPVMNAFVRVGTALLPLGLAPLLLILIGDGRLNFGGGEKDILLLIPWVLWSTAFAVSSLVLWHRGWPTRRAMRRSALVGVGVLLAAAAFLVVSGP